MLLDAGAGDQWRYVEPGTQEEYERSEGIAIASLHMFKALVFAADKTGKAPIVDGKYQQPWSRRDMLTRRFIGKGLESLNVDALTQGFQISGSNPMPGVSSRTELLNSLGKSLLAHSNIFGEEGRPGKLVGMNSFYHHS